MYYRNYNDFLKIPNFSDFLNQWHIVHVRLHVFKFNVAIMRDGNVNNIHGETRPFN